MSILREPSGPFPFSSPKYQSVPSGVFSRNGKKSPLWSIKYEVYANCIWRRFDWHTADFPASRLWPSAGRIRPIRTASIPITARSSMMVKPRFIIW